MAYLEIDGVIKSYGGQTALNGVSFTAGKGELIALLGPSGCGKTTLLNVIAGFLAPDSGAIRLGGRDLSLVPTHRRDMAMVFQSYALFPHMSVERNVAYGLEMRSEPKAGQKRKVAEALELVKLAGLGSRFPRELSGGQQQRVALARALVVRPSVLLLDEPLSNLDTMLRKGMREDMREILKHADITAILVTHDQEEALVTADRIILMSAGHIDQIATPEELYERPRTVFGARFMEATNFIEGVVAACNGTHTAVQTPLGLVYAEPAKVSAGDRVTVSVRPQRVNVGEPLGENRVAGKVLRESYHGTSIRLDLLAGQQTIVAHVPPGRKCPARDEIVEVSWACCDTRILTEAAPAVADRGAR